MNPQAEMAVQTWMGLAILAALAGCLWIWTRVAVRWQLGLPILPYRPRRWVPWRGWDVGLVVAAYLLGLEVARIVIAAVLGPDLLRPLPLDEANHADTTHLVVRLVNQGNAWTLLVAGLMAVVVAPVVEEFLFRVVFQGWLEAVERRYRRAVPTFERLLPGAAGPIVLSSFLFAAMHFRVATLTFRLEYIAAMLVGQAAVNLLTVALAVGLLRLRAGATAADLGWTPGYLAGDVRLGLLAFVAIAAPLYLLQFLLVRVLPEHVAPDPITLFFFAVVLGTLYHRTHRLAPPVVLHMALNFTSLMMAWFLAAR